MKPDTSTESASKSNLIAKRLGAFCVAWLMPLLFLLTVPAAVNAGDFSYTISGTTATISAYSGSDSSVDIPGTIDGFQVIGIGAYAFNSNTNVTSIKIPDSVIRVGEGAFWGCTSLSSITIPSSVTIIGDGAFYCCASLTSVTLPDNITNIGTIMFAYCTSLSRITIPSHVTTIGNSAFAYCTSMQAILFKGNAPTPGTGMFAYDTSATVYYLAGTTGWGTTFGGLPTVMVTIPTVTWTNPAPILYGTLLSGTQLNAKSSVSGKFTYSPGAGTRLPVGTNILNVLFTPTDITHYASVQRSVSITVSTLLLSGLNQVYNGQPRTVTASTFPAGMAVSLTYNGAVEPPVNAGSYAVTAQIVNSNPAVTTTGTLVVAKADQAITFPPLPTGLHLGDVDCLLTATASSGLPVGYTTSAPGVATIVNGKLHIVSAGNAIITALQPGNANWNTAPAAQQVASISKKPQTINFPVLSSHAVGEADFAPGATASSGLAVTYASSNSAVATIVNGKIHFVAKGSTVIAAVQAGNSSWAAATTLKQTLTVSAGTQTITFPALPGKKYGDVDFVPGAKASSGLPPAYTSSNLSVASIISGKIHITGAGTTTITATQPGNANWNPAAPVTQSLTVAKGTPVVTWANPAAIVYGTPLSATQLNAKANVVGQFVYSPVTGTKLASGTQTLSVTFKPTDSARYTTAQKSVSLIVKKALATITLGGLSQVHNGQPRPVTATTVPAGLNVTFTYAGAVTPPINVGSYAVTATVVDKNGTGTKTGTLVITKGNQTISFGALPVMKIGDLDKPLTATASSGQPVSYTSSAPAVATIVGGKLHVVGSGTTSITASQGGNANWNAATAVRQTLTVLTEDQAIRAFYAQLKSRMESHDQPGFLALFASDYIHQGWDVVDRFEPGFLDTISTFTFNITGITITGSNARVSGSATVSFNNGTPAYAWAEPDTTGSSDGLGWLRKTSAGWQVIGDQVRAVVKVETSHDATPADDHYFFEMRAESSLEITGVSVSGSGIDTTELQPDAEQGGFTGFAGHFTDADRPAVGTAYTFVVKFADGSEETYVGTIKSWVTTAPAVSVKPGSGTALIQWSNVSSAVPNAKSYGVRLYGAAGETDTVWSSSEDVPLTQTSIAFNADGTATGSLVSGQSYTAVVTIFDGYNNYALGTYHFTMP